MSLIAAPGFYPELTPDDYFAEPCPAPALTNSGIKALLGSCPAKFWHLHPALGGGEGAKSSAAQVRGNLVHRLALGKGDEYAISPFDEYRSKDAKAWRDETEAAGVMPVKRKDFEAAEAMAAVIRGRIEEACQGHDYQTEVVIAWRERMNTGTVWCRAMLDVWCPALLLGLDVKTCNDASDTAVVRAFANGYATQDVWYKRGLETLTGEHGRARFAFLFVEDSEPHLSRQATASEAFRHGAGLDVARGLAIFSDCLSRGDWPGYDPLDVHPPSWLVSRWTAGELLEAAE